MRTYRKLLAVIALSGMCFAAAAPSENEGAVKKSKKHSARMEAKAPCEACEAIKRLEDKVAAQQAAMAAQQAEIDALKTAQQPQPTNDEQAREAAAAAKQAADAAAAAAAEANANANAVKSDVSDLKTTNATAVLAVQDTQKRVTDLENPLAIHYKGVNITPGGFIDATMLWRQRAENADVASSFNNIPYANNSFAHMTEFRGSARHSRLTLLGEGLVGSTKLTGYYEMDFLGAAPTANENQSSSFNIRARQLFGEASTHDWTFTGGQTWSLLTTNKRGIATRGEWIPMTIDSQYTVGFTYARLMTARVTRRFNNGKATVAFSVENPASIFTAQPATVVTGGPGTKDLGNGNTYTTNLAPDLIAKVAFDPSFAHFEIKAMGRFFRDRILATGNNDVTLGGGVGAAVIVPVAHKKVNLIAEGFWGRGSGRYGDSLQTDASFHPDGTIAPIKSIRGVGGIEVHVTPKLDWYLYGGDEYLGRNFYAATGGYGNPNVSNANCFTSPEAPGAACAASIRNLVQGTTGLWYDIYKGGYGRLRYGLEYSWTYKNTWADAAGLSPTASDSMAFSTFRFMLP